MMQVTLRIAGQAFFGVDLLGAAHDLGAAFTAYSEFVNYRFKTPFPLPLWWPTRMHRHFKAAVTLVDQTVQGIIAARRAAASTVETRVTTQDRPVGDRPHDLLDMLMAARDAETGQSMTDQELRHEIAMMMFAGHETTAVALTWTLYLLSQHPEATRKLHNELAEALAGRTPTMHDVPALRYTRMVLDEALRLYPPAWAVGRQPMQDDAIGGYHIPAGSSVTLVINNVHRDPRW
jgi:cytochrome P450